MILRLCLGVFDDKEGPVPIFSFHVSPVMAKKVVLKTMVGGLSFEGKDSLEEMKSESIVNFQEEEFVVFSIFFDVFCAQCRAKKKVFSLSILFPMTEQKKIYSYANNLSHFLKKLSELFREEFTTKGEFSEEFLRKIRLLLEENVCQVTIICPICKAKNNLFAFNLEDKDIFLQKILPQEICPHAFSLYLNREFKILLYNLPEVDLSELSNYVNNIQTPYNHLEAD